VGRYQSGEERAELCKKKTMRAKEHNCRLLVIVRIKSSACKEETISSGTLVVVEERKEDARV
jgi:hypothetical protein